MQTWPGRRQRSSSVVLLSKLSAMVRRSSAFQSNLEDARSSSQSLCCYEEKVQEDDDDEDDEEEAHDGDHDDEDDNEDGGSDGRTKETAPSAPRCSTGTTATVQSSITMWNPCGSGTSKDGSIERLQFYPVRPLAAATLVRPPSHEERWRRATLEVQMGEFGALHASFAPAVLTLHGQHTEDKATRKAEEEATDGVSIDGQKSMEGKGRRSVRRSAAEDVAPPFDENSDLERSEACASGDELLHFDQADIQTSVRKLMGRIESESLIEESDVLLISTAAKQLNQSADCGEEADDGVDDTEDVDELELDNSCEHGRVSGEQEKTSLELAHELSPTEHQLQQRRRTQLLGCAAEHAMLSAQDQLTSSVRRLVIELKDDSDQMRKPLAQSYGLRRKSALSPKRGRAGSCPSAYDLGISSPSDDGSLMLTPPPLSPTSVSQEVHPGKKHKKSAFSRICPRVLATLHLRKKRKTYLFTDEELETIEGARWKIVELAFRFGGKHRSYLVQAINMFFPLLKYGRRGGAHATRLHCNCCGTLQWQHKRGGLSRAVDLAEVLQVLNGRQTAVFRKYPSTNTLEALSFSIVFRDRTLDLETKSSSHRDWIVSALRTLVAYARRQRRIEQQAIAERTILPLEDDELPPPISVGLLPMGSPPPMAAQANRQLDESTSIAASPTKYKLRTVY
ncbi:unnamed protein product [Hyaloperonospora brassicae]|uniref:PH domain-containing protein n=1 Tax=Hyaloperonospora brassicae TaxID=162125 RepID=A0AAV0T5P2_HYABA|nr:unnamed protein product [Hyaloperonospora brassicae]